MSWTSEAEVSGKFQRKTEMYLPGEQKPDSEQTKIAGVCTAQFLPLLFVRY